MIGRIVVGLSFLAIATVVHADECVILQPGAPAYENVYQSMSGHFPVEPTNIQYCGLFGWSKLYTAAVDTYQTYKNWAKSGELRCWEFSDHKTGTPIGCGVKIISTNSQSQIEIDSQYEIPLAIVDEAVFALTQVLSEGDTIASMNYVPVQCGGAWSIENHGYLMKLKSIEQGVVRKFVVKKNCSPTPCLWEVEELEPEYRVS